MGKLDGGAKGGVIGGAQDAEHVAAGLDARLGNLAAAVHDLDVGKDGLGGIGVLDGADGAGALGNHERGAHLDDVDVLANLLEDSHCVLDGKEVQGDLELLVCHALLLLRAADGTAVFAKAFASHRAERMAMPSVAFEPIGKRRLNVC